VQSTEQFVAKTRMTYNKAGLEVGEKKCRSGTIQVPLSSISFHPFP